jgi:hypothetical protein
MKKPSADFSRRIFLEGWVLPNRLKNFRHGRAVPSELSPNEFGAQEKKFVINHWLKPVS